MSLQSNAQVEYKSSEDPIFDDIRPCRDNEVKGELEKIYNDEELIDGIIRFKYPLLYRFAAFVLKPLVKAKLRNYCQTIKTIDDFQEKVASYMRHMMHTTTDGVEFVGFDKLDNKKGYLFVSNHRDISLDPAFVDFGLHECGFDTVRIAIGDNLLRIPAATALMRLNKSFIVKRKAMSPREKLRAITTLSAYIGLSIKEGNSIWIAQREGRAKDGDDRTEIAVLKMFHMYGRTQKISFKDYIKTLNIVPVSISYEYDPGDVAKANELNEKEQNGFYKKSEFEDIQSIVNGIRGYKGRVRVVAGSPIDADVETPEELASIIDKYIYENYAMFPTTLYALGQKDKIDENTLQVIEDRFKDIPLNIKQRVLSMYAMPYINRERMRRQETNDGLKDKTEDA